MTRLIRLDIVGPAKLVKAFITLRSIASLPPVNGYKRATILISRENPLRGAPRTSGLNEFKELHIGSVIFIIHPKPIVDFP
jgi:hypothetical protein